MLEVTSRRRQLAALSDGGLLRELSRLDLVDRRTQVEILLHLAEIDRRKLHVAHGSPSLFDFCTRQLRWSESAAGRRIAVARAVQRFPRIAELLLSGEVNLSTVAQVARLLTEENHQALLERIRGQSSRRVEAIVAEYRPAKKTRDRVRPLGRQRPLPAGPDAEEPRRDTDCSEGSSGTAPPPGDRRGLLGLHREIESVVGSPPTQPSTTTEVSPALRAGANERGKREEVAPDAGRCEPTPDVGSGSAVELEEPRYEVRFTAGEDFLALFERARHLLSGRYPRGATYEEVLTAALHDFVRRKDPVRRARRGEARRARAQRAEVTPRQGEASRGTPHSVPLAAPAAGTFSQGDGGPVVSRPRASPSEPSPLGRTRRSRHVPAAVRDEVYLRDGGRCTYVSPEGVRCDSQWDLELDHIVPFSLGGEHSARNLRLACASHNRHEARQKLGPVLMASYTKACAPG